MRTINFQSKTKYELLEFHYYMNEEHINIVELLLNTSDLSTIEQDFSNTFIVDTDLDKFVFIGYEVTDSYLDKNLVRVVCVNSL